MLNGTKGRVGARTRARQNPCWCYRVNVVEHMNQETDPARGWVKGGGRGVNSITFITRRISPFCPVVLFCHAACFTPTNSFLQTAGSTVRACCGWVGRVIERWRGVWIADSGQASDGASSSCLHRFFLFDWNVHSPATTTKQVLYQRFAQSFSSQRD